MKTGISCLAISAIVAVLTVAQEGAVFQLRRATGAGILPGSAVYLKDSWLRIASNPTGNEPIGDFAIRGDNIFVRNRKPKAPFGEWLPDNGALRYKRKVNSDADVNATIEENFFQDAIFACETEELTQGGNVWELFSGNLTQSPDCTPITFDKYDVRTGRMMT